MYQSFLAVAKRVHVPRAVRLGLLVSSLSLALSAKAEDFVVLGQPVRLTPPAGLCAIGRTPDERRYFEQLQSLAASTGLLLQVAVPCPDLERSLAGTISHFPTTVTVMVVKARGQLRRDPRSRAQFMAALGAPGPVDIPGANTRMRAALSATDVAVSLSSMTPLGSDEWAVYWAVTGTAGSDGEEPRKTASVIAALLVNGLQLSVQATEAVGVLDGPGLATLAQRYVMAVVSSNEP
jgi:hypothetical protein